jgi:hypothetical protein
LVLDQSRELDREKSRRVVFKIRLRSMDQLAEASHLMQPLESATVSSRLF